MGGNGTAVAWSPKYVSGNNLGTRAVRWDGTGTSATELGNLGTDSNGVSSGGAFAVNGAGTAVGYAAKYVSGNSLGDRAVRWNSSGIAPTELGNLGVNWSGNTTARAYAINESGAAVGFAMKFTNGDAVGSRAVRWNASDTTATELGNLGTNSSGFTDAQAYAVNDAGISVGWCQKYVSGNSVGGRAVRWNGTGTTATELGNLGLSGSGGTFARANAVNESGTAVGYATKWVSGGNVGARAVRWDGTGTTATELGNLGTNSSGYTNTEAYDVNESGAAVGYADKWVSGSSLGARAVRWDGTGTAATELGNLGANSSGYSYVYAYAMNDAGTAVGYARKYVAGSDLGNRAVIWRSDNVAAIDLNELGVVANPKDGTWVLNVARAMSSDGWVAGMGMFTPKVGAAYQRAWVTQVGFGGTWTNSLSGTLDGTWGRGKQWSTGTPAMQVGDAAFSANANYTVSLDRNESTRTISVTAGTVVLNTNGHNLESTATTSIGSGAMLAVDDSAGGNVSVGALAGEGRLHVRSQMLTVGGSGASTTFSGRIEGAGSLTKTGTGTQTLSGANEYTGITSVTGGTLLVNNTTGSGTGYGNVDVVGGTLGGTGSIAGAVTIGSGGTLAPGASIETLNVGALTFNSGSTFSYEMNTNLSLTVAADLVNASGDLTFAATDVALAITDAGSTLLAGAKLTLIAYSGNWNGGTFAGHPNNSLITVGLNQYALKYNDTTMGQNFATESLAGAGVHYVTLTAVPEARAFVMLGLVGVVASAFVWLKQRRLAAQSD